MENRREWQRYSFFGRILLCVIALSAFFAPWKSDVYQLGKWFGLVVVVVSLGLYLYEKQHRKRRHIAATRNAEERSNQLALAAVLAEKDAILQNALVGVVLLRNRKIINCNRRLEEIFGYQPGEMLGQLSRIFYPNEAVFDDIGKRAYEVAGQGGDFGEELLLRRKNGEIFWGELTGRAIDPLHPQDGSIWIYSDISERKKAEEELKASEQRFQDIVNISADWIWEVDKQGRFTYVSNSVKDVLGFASEEILGKTSFDLMPPEEAGRLMPVFAAIARERKPFRNIQNINRHKDGSLRVMQTSGVPLLDGDGRLLGHRGLDRDVTESTEMETALRESQARYRTLIEEAPDGIILFDVDLGSVTDCNAAAEKIFGCDREELLNSNMERFSHPEQFAGQTFHKIAVANFKKISAGATVLVEQVIRSAKGKKRTCEVRISAMPAKNSRLLRSSWIDITGRKQAETELRIAATALESVEGLVISDANGVIMRVNQAFAEITGYSPEEAVGRKTNLLRSGRHDDAFYAEMWAGINGQGLWKGEIWNRRKNGEIYPEWLSISAVKGPTGSVSHYVGTFTDITQHKKAESQIRELAYFDSLTQLPNRRLLFDRLGQALAASVRNNRDGGLMFIDLDNFKMLNDTLGHAAGDQLLVQVARRVTDCVRDADTVARLGGDEFVVMLEDLSGKAGEAAAQIEVVGRKILATLNQPFVLGSQVRHSTASIGATLFGEHQWSIDELMKQADIAMYQAKAAGRNTLCFFDPELQEAIKARAALESDLRQGIQAGQLLLYYQPQVDAGGLLIGAEALVRWLHPERGLISPAEFIPLAEETGLILPLGQWVLETACRQIAAWATRPDMAPVTLAVNVSARQFGQVDFVEQVSTILHQTGADPQKLKLELTEGLLVENVQDIIAKMYALKSGGVGFSLDDFGTGYSSLSYLKRLPLSQLKIDQSFVRDVLTDNNDAAIARTIIALAQSLGLAVIAEGVETEEQRDFLGNYGCQTYQGYLFGRPAPLNEFETMPGGSLAALAR